MSRLEVSVQAVATDSYFSAKVGPINVEGGFLFGETAEVTAFSPMRDEAVEYEVSFPAIGSHDTRTGRRRLLSYKTAIAIAEQLNHLTQHSSSYTFERAAATYDGTTFTE